MAETHKRRQAYFNTIRTNDKSGITTIDQAGEPYFTEDWVKGLFPKD